jgi:hypothetical protein
MLKIGGQKRADRQTDRLICTPAPALQAGAGVKLVLASPGLGSPTSPDWWHLAPVWCKKLHGAWGGELSASESAACSTLSKSDAYCAGLVWRKYAASTMAAGRLSHSGRESSVENHHPYLLTTAPLQTGETRPASAVMELFCADGKSKNCSSRPHVRSHHGTPMAPVPVQASPVFTISSKSTKYQDGHNRPWRMDPPCPAPPRWSPDRVSGRTEGSIHHPAMKFRANELAPSISHCIALHCTVDTESPRANCHCFACLIGTFKPS